MVNGVKYYNKENIDKNIFYDLAIVISDANEFRRVHSKKKQFFQIVINQ